MFELFPKQAGDEAKSILTSQVSWWVAMSQSILDGAKAMADLNLNTAHELLSGSTAALTSGSAENGEAPGWARFGYVPDHAENLLVYGREVQNICATVHDDIVKCAQGSFSDTTRDMPWLSKNADAAADMSKLFVHMYHAGQPADGEQKTAKTARPARKSR